MINIVCIKFGTKYSPEYVDKLFRGIKRNTSKSFLFTCYTDNKTDIQEDINIKPLPYSTGTWFDKIGLYNKDLYHEDDQIFLFDLDTVIIKNIDDILEYSGNFICLQDFYRKTGLGSGLVSWRPTYADFLWKNYPRGYKSPQGDQGWLEEKRNKLNPDIWQEKYPGKVISYKVHIKSKGLLKNKNHTNNPGSLKTGSIVCFHGRPLPHEERNLEWMKEHWL